MHIAHEAENLIASLRVKACRRLIKNHDLRLHSQNSRDGGSTLLSPGELKRGDLIIFFSHADELQRFLRASLLFFLRKTEILRAELHIREYIRLKKLVLRVLKDKSHLRAEFSPVVILSPDILSIVENFARRRPQKSVHRLHECGFSGAGMPDEPYELAVRNFARNAVDGVRCHHRAFIIDVGDVIN